MVSDTRFSAYPSEVVLIRLPPADIMSCVDACDKAGIVTAGMSLAMMVRVAVSCMCETLREENVLPRRDGFEYEELTGRFKRSARRGKMHIARATNDSIRMRMVQDLPAVQPIQSGLQALPQTGNKMSIAMRQLLSNIKEMTNKKNMGDPNYQIGEPGYIERENLILLFKEQGGAEDDLTS